MLRLFCHGLHLPRRSLTEHSILLEASASCRVNSAPPAIERSRSSYKLMSNVNFKVDRVVNAIPTINQNHMSPDDDVTVAPRGTAHTAGHFIGCRTTHPPHIIIENVTWPNPVFVVVV